MRKLADYTIEETLPADAPGMRYHRARRDGEATPVLVRELVHHATDEAFRRFSTEIRAMHAVQSPHVVPMLDAGVVDGVLYAVSPWYDAGTLADDPGHASGDGVATARDLGAVVDAARGVHDLHEGGVLHRNVRPHAIVRDAGGGRVGDLGLVQLLWPGVASTGFGPLGSIAYGDPAVLLGRPAARTSDVWSLAATAHWVATGHPVFADLDSLPVPDALRRVAAGRATLATVPGTALDTVLRTALDAEPRNRFPTAAGFADALAAAVPDPGGTP